MHLWFKSWGLAVMWMRHGWNRLSLELVNKPFFFFFMGIKGLFIHIETYVRHLCRRTSPKLMGKVCKLLYKEPHGLHCPEKYLSFYLKTLWGIKDESEPFSSLLWLWSAMETATNIYVRQTLEHRGAPRSREGASTTKGDDALSHWCNPNLHPCAQDLKQA